MDGEISPADVRALVDAGEDVRIVDIRPRKSFEAGHIPGSESIPLAVLPAEVDRLAGANRIVTVCPVGRSSVRAAWLIASHEAFGKGTRIESMAGGLDGWPYALEAGGSAGDGGVTDAPF